MYKQLTVSNFPIAFQQTIMERPLNDMQRQSQPLSSLIEVVYAFPEDSVQFV
jgi:hypothetical protein